ncbi:uncharacterized protein LOC129323173 [Prosopis cineraria]|uniref:uncharacterized protein LOC129323173 n=1 Tax=Prosopis cineraria TaxID=364024 RepID=UPI00240FA753|nr:uncharacterized protein LOC129323173 [Prosopis cineraria]
MFRSLTARRGHGIGRYERLGKEASAVSPLIPQELKRSTSLPVAASSRKVATFGGGLASNLKRQPTKKASKEKSHPLFSFMDFRRKKKPTSRPEFARYLQYLKEGGIWDLNSSKPVIYYK